MVTPHPTQNPVDKPVYKPVDNLWIKSDLENKSYPQPPQYFLDTINWQYPAKRQAFPYPLSDLGFCG